VASLETVLETVLGEMLASLPTELQKVIYAHLPIEYLRAICPIGPTADQRDDRAYSHSPSGCSPLQREVPSGCSYLHREVPSWCSYLYRDIVLRTYFPQVNYSKIRATLPPHLRANPRWPFILLLLDTLYGNNSKAGFGLYRTEGLEDLLLWAAYFGLTELAAAILLSDRGQSIEPEYINLALEVA